MMEDLTLSVVSHGQGALLSRLLADLSRIPTIGKARLIVTLNVPGEPFDGESAFPRLNLQVIRNESPKGFGANHNAAFTRCTTAWFAVLNPDLRLPDDPFADLFEHARLHRNLAALAPAVINSAGLPEDHVRPNLTPLSLWRRRRKVVESVDVTRASRFPDTFYWLAGMFILFRSDAFRAVGGFDPGFFLYCEDYDVCARLYSAGHGLGVVPAARAVHDAQRDSHRSRKHLSWHLKSLARLWLSASFWRITVRQRPSTSS